MPRTIGADKQRLFFALWPDDSLRATVDVWRRAQFNPVPGRLVTTANLHVTLVFLGTVDAEMRQKLENMANGLKGEPVNVCLDTVGYWLKPKILVLKGGSQPPQLIDFVNKMREGVEACGHTVDSRPYQAHMTLIRKVAEPASGEPLPFAPHLSLQAHEFCLVESKSTESGVVYSVLKTWAFEG